MMRKTTGGLTGKMANMKVAVACIILVVVILSVVFICGERKDNRQLFGIKVDDGPPIYSVSLINLIASPDNYDGKRVYVQGYFVNEHRDVSLYLEESHYVNLLFRNAISVDKRNANPDILFESLQGKYVAFIGVFSANEHRYQVYTRGTLHNITLAREIPKRITVDQESLGQPLPTDKAKDDGSE